LRRNWANAPRWAVEGDDQSWPACLSADAGRRLDVLGGVLRLADHEHQPEPGDIDADLQHRGGQHDVDRQPVAVLRRDRLPPLLPGGDVLGDDRAAPRHGVQLRVELDLQVREHVGDVAGVDA
jgi:hypothetical protein